MQSRWFHLPLLHTHGTGVEKKVTWLELFFDLIFVAAFIQLGNGLANHVSVDGFTSFAGLLVPLWISWAGFTYFINRFTVDDITQRLMTFGQMFAVEHVGDGDRHAADGEPHRFAFTYAVAQTATALMYIRAWRQVPEARTYCSHWGGRFAAGAVLWTISGFVPAPYCYALWAIGVLVILAAPLSRHTRALNEQFPLDEEHLSERFGLLTLIVLGESFVKVLSQLATHGADWYAIMQACGTLLITCCIWWIYFDDVAGARVKRKRFAAELWMYAHLLLQVAVVATGVSLKKAVMFDLDQVAPDAYRWLLAGTLALTLFSVAVIDSVAERRQAELSDRARVNARLLSALLMLLLAPAGGSMTALTFLGLVATICVSQVVFDMMIAPLMDSPAGSDEATPAAELAKETAAGKLRMPPASDASMAPPIRKDAPPELRRDLYFYFMEGSWKRFFGSLAFIYLITNVFFAALYTLEPGCIDGSATTSFADAFFFSVQTLSTIGFGALSPATEYANTVVTIEAAMGMLGVALATGLVFAKASRPSSGALFSNNLIIQPRNGVPTLMFRVGNARGNDVVDASISITIVMDEISAEGEHLARVHDLKLVRSTSPMFQMSWVVMHELDPDSPLAGIDWSEPPPTIYRIIVAMHGHDGTYGQTVHARKLYGPADVLPNRRFVDVIHRLPDGRMMIDYAKFHDTEPLK